MRDAVFFLNCQPIWEAMKIQKLIERVIYIIQGLMNNPNNLPTPFKNPKEKRHFNSSNLQTANPNTKTVKSPVEFD